MKKLAILLFLVLSMTIYAQDGTLDLTFGVVGVVELSVESNRIEQHKMLDDGKSMILSNQEGLEYLIKINEEGSIDNSFGNNGSINIEELLGISDTTQYFFKDFDVLSTGEIALGGILRIRGTVVGENDVIILKLNANGELNTEFGTDGIVKYALSDRSDNALIIDGGGKIKTTPNDDLIVTVVDFDNAYLLKVNTDGTIDSSFGTDGVFEYPAKTYGRNTLAIDADGNIFYGDDIYLIKLFSNGLIDSSFGYNGHYQYHTHYFKEIDFQSDGKIIATANYWGLDQSVTSNIIRINQNGTLDESFAENGEAQIFLGQADDISRFNGTAIDEFGNIVVGGYLLRDDSRFLLTLAKLDNNGELIPCFGDGGKVVLDLFEDTEEFAQGFIFNSADKEITVSAIRINSDVSSNIILARFLNSSNCGSAHFSGEVSGDWGHIDTAYIDGDIVVPLNETLTIQPGTKVYFKGEYKMDVFGQLLANGTENDNIYFFSEGLIPISTYPDYEGFWYGITFHSTDENQQPASSLNYCDLKDGFGRWVDEASSSYNRRFGGGLIFYKSTIDVSNTKFTDCIDGHNKGGVITSIISSGALQNISMHAAGSISLLDSEVNIDGLDMTDADGLYIENASGFIKNAKVYDNRGYNNYGIIHFENSNFQLEKSEILDNYDFGITAKSSTLNIDRTLIKGNGGVGAYFIESPSVITSCEILENAKEGLWFNSETEWQTVFTSTIKNCVIAKNGEAGLRFLTNNNANIINSTIADNTSSDSWGGIKVGSAEVNVTNSIVYNNGGDLDFQAGGEFTYSIIQGNYSGSDVATTNLQNVDPLFRDAANGDYHLQSTACGDAADSPGIDAGDPTIGDLVLDCETAGLGTYSSDIGAYGGANNRWDNDIMPPCSFSGEVSGVWDCETITVEGDITILEGDTLTITSAVDNVVFTGPYQITVQGVLLAYGPENDITDLGTNYIKFQGSDWHGIVFSSTNDREVGTSIIENCRFDYANRLDAPNPNGGALLIYHSDNVIVKQSVFYANAGQLGGAIYIENSDAHIEDCYFQLNGKEVGQTGEAITTAGGAMYVKNSNPYLHRLQFLDNYSISGGGAVILDNSSSTMSNILMVRNSTGGLGGAMQLVAGSSPTIVNMTSADNIAETAGGSFYLNPDSNPTIINSIMYGNSKPEIYLGGGTPSVTYSIIDAASSESYFGNGCLDEDPYFATGTNYKLSNNSCSYSDGNTVISPAIDAGHPDSLDVVLDCYQGLGTQRADMGYYGGGLSTIHVGTVDLSKTYTFNIYPNPTRNTVTLDLSIPVQKNVSEIRKVSNNLTSL